jgi:glycosyltransferase involved in cell wall biosynthesis
MKAFFVSETQGWSGGAAQLLALAKGLQAIGWSVTIGSPENGEAAKRAVAAGIPHTPLHPRQDYDLVTARRLAKLVDRLGVDVLHAHHPRAHAVGLASLFLMRRKPVFVVSRRVSFAVKKNPFSRLKYRNPRIDAFISVADNVRRELVGGGVPPEKVRTIPSGVDTEVFSPREADSEIRNSLSVPEGAALIGKIANFSDWKGQKILLEAGAKLLEAGRDVVLLFAGRDTDGDEIKAAAKEAGFPEEKARFLGFRSDVDALLPCLDVSVNAAVRGEGISGALRESLSMEIPCAASDAGGNAELVVEGITGRLFKAGHAGDLARVLGEVLDDRETAKKQAKRGREVVVERFSVDCMVRSTDKFYRELLDAKKG